MPALTETLLDLLHDLARDLRTEVEALSADALRWRPHPRANSIGVTVWHVARWLDLLGQRLLRGLDDSAELWQRDGWAERTGYDPRGIGLRGWGVVTGYTPEDVDRIPELSAGDLLAYLDATASALRDAISELGAGGLGEAPRGFTGRRSAYDWIKGVLEGALGHLGEVRALRALHGWVA